MLRIRKARFRRHSARSLLLLLRDRLAARGNLLQHLNLDLFELLVGFAASLVDLRLELPIHERPHEGNAQSHVHESQQVEQRSDLRGQVQARDNLCVCVWGRRNETKNSSASFAEAAASRMGEEFHSHTGCM